MSLGLTEVLKGGIIHSMWCETLQLFKMVGKLEICKLFRYGWQIYSRKPDNKQIIRLLIFVYLTNLQSLTRRKKKKKLLISKLWTLHTCCKSKLWQRNAYVFFRMYLFPLLPTNTFVSLRLVSVQLWWPLKRDSSTQNGKTCTFPLPGGVIYPSRLFRCDFLGFEDIGHREVHCL